MSCSVMGCGHSKINIYPKKYKNRNSPKKSVLPEKMEREEEEVSDSETELNKNLEDYDPRRPIKVKSFGGPLLAQAEISSSQQNFFKMLDEKIENGPDYDSTSELERTAEAERLRSLMKDWETASIGSRSLPTTPSRRSKLREMCRNDNLRNAEIHRNKDFRVNDVSERNQYPQKIIQSFGIAHPSYRQVSYNPIYQPTMVYSSAMQYQALSPMYISQSPYQPPPKHYSSYSQHENVVKTVYQNNSVKHIPCEQPQVTYSPSHKIYGSVTRNNPNFTNGELLVQQQMYNEQMQYQQTREYQQYRQSKEQMLLHQQGYHQSPKNYQSSVHIPMVLHAQQSNMNSLHRKQYEMT